MSYLFETLPQRLDPAQAAGGEASLADIYRASRQAMIHVDNTLSRGAAMEEAYRRRVRAIEEATGETIENPAESAFRGMPERAELEDIGRGESRYAAAKRRFQTRLGELEKLYPGATDIIRAARPIEEDAAEIAREAEGRLSDATASRPGIGKWAALFAGGMAGALRDPLQVALLVAGGGPGGARTVAGRILQTAGREALINAGGEAALQPVVQSWREEAGLPSGFAEAIKNVAFAGALGGALGSAGQGAAEALRAVVPRIKGKLSEKGKAILSDNPMEVAPALEPIREVLPPQARGALDAIEVERAMETVRPEALPREIHETNVSVALKATQDGIEPAFRPDPAQAARIIAELAPAETGAGAKAPQTLSEFLIAAGGVEEFRGELAAIGADKVKRRGKGSLVKDGGRTLDDARLIAAEAGYMNDRFGTPDNAVARSTVADFLDLLDEDIRTGRVTAEPQAASVTGEAAISAIARDIDRLQRVIGPGIKDADVIAAINRANETGEDILDAWTSLPEPEAVPRNQNHMAADDFPGWDEASLDALDNRMSGIDDPANPPSTVLDEPDELAELMAADGGGTAVPFDDTVMSAAAIDDTIKRTETMRQLVEACRA